MIRSDKIFRFEFRSGHSRLNIPDTAVTAIQPKKIVAYSKYVHKLSLLTQICYLYKFSVSSIVDGKGFPFVSGSNKQSKAAMIPKNPNRTTGRLSHTCSRINRSGTRIPPIRDEAENHPSPLLLV